MVVNTLAYFFWKLQKRIAGPDFLVLLVQSIEPFVFFTFGLANLRNAVVKLMCSSKTLAKQI
ncbi:hypothetical protein DLH88_22775 [Vibrio parahaemolyticus]|nr:hypothetical protein [Vibrio parahaemolyticus]EGR3154630.1 hypothetical protein [Vibrio parahaemolyticus]TOA70318.1 hypothetical protein CGK21_12590 [Vibrio parahaemolyticus]TOA83256.1 hypothetical protein CGK18_21335 [Vibrio parahaemolyticus]TOD74389.1 hypothetical protein CGJ57_21425 [Vibrio parahaemolyticus]